MGAFDGQFDSQGSIFNLNISPKKQRVERTSRKRYIFDFPTTLILSQPPRIIKYSFGGGPSNNLGTTDLNYLTVYKVPGCVFTSYTVQYLHIDASDKKTFS